MDSELLNKLDSLPDEFLECKVTELADILPGPSLVHLHGSKQQPIFISILLHGNETVGFNAVQSILCKYRNQELPRAISLFIGNVAAARQGVRRLDTQADYNRVWPSLATQSDTPEHHLMRQVVTEMKSRNPFVSIDLHNNTGLNPHYACINKLDHKFFHLATLFSHTVVYFLRPYGVQSMAFAEFCPAVTLECGRIDDDTGISHAVEFIDTCLHLEQLPDQAVAYEDIHLFHTVATVKVPADISFGFGETSSDLTFIKDIEFYNFRELPVGTLLGYYDQQTLPHLDIVDEYGNTVEQRFLQYNEGEIRLATPIMPSMLTLNEKIIRQDCLCYFMERYPMPDF
jgi:succinylglutamate desuccinylase